MENLMAFAESVGLIVIIIGSICVILFALCFCWWALSSIWIAASNKFRDICRAESLIFEYRRERDAYLQWKKTDNAQEAMKDE